MQMHVHPPTTTLVSMGADMIGDEGAADMPPLPLSGREGWEKLEPDRRIHQNGYTHKHARQMRRALTREFDLCVFICSLLYESPGGNQVDGLPPASHTEAVWVPHGG